MTEAKVGLALSGGGFRATAFGLGCLRALQDADVLPKVQVVSGVSGGSLLAALWAYGPVEFAEFDAFTVDLLRRGMQLEIAGRTLAPHNLLRSAVNTGRAALPWPRRRPRTFNRTEALRTTLASRAFGDRLISEPNRPGLNTVISATDLITARTVRFGSNNSSCSQYGRIVEPVTVAEAVAASAAYPVFLPAVERSFTFDQAGQRRSVNVALTDGGVYDNLGLSVLEPGRSPDFTNHVYDVDYIIACDAGRQELGSSGARFWPFRLYRSFYVTYRKTQDGGRAKLHLAAAAGHLRGFVHAYLGMRDERLPVPVPDLVPLARVNAYRTSFRAVSPEDLAALTGRGEQLTQALLGHYCPDL